MRECAAIDLLYSSGTIILVSRPLQELFFGFEMQLGRGKGLLTVNLTSVDSIGDGLGALAVNLASNTVCRSQNLLDTTLQRLRERLVAHGSRNLDDLLQRNRLVVLDVLLLLAIAGGLLEGADDEGGGSGDNGDGGLTVLDSELDRHAEALL